MDNLQYGIAALLFIILFYCVRSLRALHRKTSRQNDRINKGFQKAAADARERSLQDYRQTEAFIQLNSLLNFTAPIPATRGWAGSPDLLLTIAHTVKSKKPALVVELGSGVSTLVSAKSGAKKVISFDGSQEYAGKTRELLAAHKVRGVEVRYSPLAPFKEGAPWYSPDSFKDIKKIDVLIIDGPQGGEHTFARYPALEVLLSKLSPKAIIILDDVKREGERKLAEDFAAALPKHTLTILEHEKGTAIISPVTS